MNGDVTRARSPARADPDGEVQRQAGEECYGSGVAILRFTRSVA